MHAAAHKLTASPPRVEFRLLRAPAPGSFESPLAHAGAKAYIKSMTARLAIAVALILLIAACESTVTRVEGGSKGVDSWSVGVRF